MVAHLTGEQGIPLDDARVITDMALHAVETAITAITRIADTAPPHLRGTVIISSAIILEQSVRLAIQRAKG
jgi:hypothetical protein